MNEIQRDQLWKFLRCQEDGQIPSDVTLAEHLQKWKAEEAARLRRIENEVRHEWNRERYLKEAQEKRERKVP
ncbi:hypothetical protein AAFF_G00435860 [Aldrovandia affinis]|uniref:Uncharacterized protein n=1 Tax=Aldrovandia affinis TaxID=143900 RepID=A0AAD7VYC7_9TELE|nr:hypothetical protein AAFF_G00435860 [Aldrovandia affinis]